MKRVWQALPFAYYMLTLAPHPPLPFLHTHTHFATHSHSPKSRLHTITSSHEASTVGHRQPVCGACRVLPLTHTMVWRGGRGGVFGSFKLIDLNQFLTLTYYAQFLDHSCGQIIFITHTLRWTAAEKGSTRQV